MEAQPATNWEFKYLGSAEAVRSDGRERRTLIDAGVRSVDFGAAGVLYAAQESVPYGMSTTGSVLTASVTGKSSEPIYADESGTSYFSVAASSTGAVAIQRVTSVREVPQFLSEGVEALRSTTLPVLVPPEKPSGTDGVVPSAEEAFYRLLFTNDPAGELAHAAQVNVFVEASTGEFDPVPGYGSQPVDVRGTDGRFFCGASACFLTWSELDVTYLVGEFGADEEAVAFAESLVPIESLAGSLWREGRSQSTPTAHLVVRDPNGGERVLESVNGSCECSFRPLDWSPENDRLLVLASAEGYTTLQQYRVDGSGETVTLAKGAADPDRRDVILDAAYGPNGVVTLLNEDGGPPGTLLPLGGVGRVMATDVRAFDIEGSTLAYLDADGDVVVRDLVYGNERTVGEGAIDVSVAPDLISESGGFVKTPAAEDGFPLLPVGIALAAAAILGGGALLFFARRRFQD